MRSYAASVMLVGLTKRLLLTGWLVTSFLVVPARATELKAATAAAFDHYMRTSEDRMSDDLHAGNFLIIDRMPTARSRHASPCTTPPMIGAQSRTTDLRSSSSMR